MLRTTVARSTALRSCVVRPAVGVTHHQTQHRNSSGHAISNPTLVDIEKRWEGLPPQEQADLWMALRDRMKVNWSELTLQEKKAAYWIAFGAHGPRSVPPPGEGWKVAGYTIAGLGISLLIFLAIRAGGKGLPKTMTKEYEEMSNEFLKNQKSEPLSGISSEGYTGKGQVQSPSAKK